MTGQLDTTKRNTVQRTWDKLPACQYLVQAMAKLRYRLTSWKLIPRSLNGIATKRLSGKELERNQGSAGASPSHFADKQ